jgi:bifunctional non-homologous end joining protein LigD
MPAEPPVVAGIRLSHPDRLIYPSLGISKQDLARYYASIARWIVPHVRGRPLTLVHCPGGVSGRCSYLRHAKAWGPDALRRVRIHEKTKVGEYLVADSVSAVVALAQMGVVEIHTWNSTADDVERPNRLVWDLDPGPFVEWPAIAGTARLLRDALKTLGLESWAKTTGGRGIHVVAPLTPALDWSACLAFARDVGRALVRANPALYTVTFAKRGRERKILIDYLRNNRTNTSICAYSPRAREGAHVSMPVGWHQLDDPPEPWTLPAAADRLRRARRDPWAGYWTASQQVSGAARSAVGRL